MSENSDDRNGQTLLIKNRFETRDTREDCICSEVDLLCWQYERAEIDQSEQTGPDVSAPCQLLRACIHGTFGNGVGFESW